MGVCVVPRASIIHNHASQLGRCNRVTEHVSVETKNGFLYISTPWRGGGTEPLRSGFPIEYENDIRKALNTRNKERKAAKKEECRFYAVPASGSWFVFDSDNPGDEHHGRFDRADAEENAKAFAKLLNKRARV